MDHDVRTALENVRHHLTVLNGNCITRDASVIEAVRWDDPPVSYAIDVSAYEAQIEHALNGNGRVPLRAHAALDGAHKLMAELRGMTLVESFVIEERPWLTNVTWLDCDAILVAIDEAILEAPDGKPRA